MKLDDRQTKAQLRQFASQVCHSCPAVKEMIEAMLDGDESDDFYAGLLAGLSAAYVFQKNKLDPDFLGHVIAHVAELMERKEVV